MEFSGQLASDSNGLSRTPRDLELASQCILCTWLWTVICDDILLRHWLVALLGVGGIYLQKVKMAYLKAEMPVSFSCKGPRLLAILFPKQ